MPEHVPILDFVHELRTAGVDVEYATLLREPGAVWSALPPGQREAVLRRLQFNTTPDAASSIRLVRRRGRPGAIEFVFVELETDQDVAPGVFRRARRALMYGPIEEPPAEARESLLVDPTPPRLIAVLDEGWGGEPYDIDGDGAFRSHDTPAGSIQIDRYDVEAPFTDVAVFRDAEDRLTYSVGEPRLTELERALASTISDRLRDILVRDARDDPRARATHLASTVFDLLRIYRFRIDRRTAYRIGYQFLRNYVGFGRLDVLMRDPNIEDISCNGPALPLYVVHSRHQNIATDLIFEETELNSLTIKLAQRGGKLLSIAQPLVDATLPGGSRIQASLGREITSRGSAFTIRKFREDPLTCVDLIRGRTHSLDSMAFLWLMAEVRRNLLVMGATASGKTTTLNCLSQFIPPTAKIVTIEDTREITLQHENWLAAVTRDSFTGSESDKISMFDLLRAALRQRPEYIIVGEIRGVEGLTLFQAMSTGHTCFSTMHAGSVENAVYRLENAPIGVPRVMLTSLAFLLLQGQVEVNGKPVRRMLSLTEFNGIDSTTRNLRTNEVFRWDADGDSVMPVAASHVLEETCEKRGWSRSTAEEQLAARRRVLEGLVERKERNYRDVAKAVRAFYDGGGNVG